MNLRITRSVKEVITSITASGDYSGDTLKFTVKGDKSLTSSRVIDKDVTASYDAETDISTFTITLLASDTAGLTKSLYYWDLRKIVDTDEKYEIESGILMVNKSVRNPTDGLTTSLTEFTVTELDSADFENKFLFSDGSTWTGYTVAELQSLLGL